MLKKYVNECYFYKIFSNMLIMALCLNHALTEKETIFWCVMGFIMSIIMISNIKEYIDTRKMLKESAIEEFYYYEDEEEPEADTDIEDIKDIENINTNDDKYKDKD